MPTKSFDLQGTLQGCYYNAIYYYPRSSAAPYRAHNRYPFYCWVNRRGVSSRDQRLNAQPFVR